MNWTTTTMYCHGIEIPATRMAHQVRSSNLQPTFSSDYCATERAGIHNINLSVSSARGQVVCGV